MIDCEPMGAARYGRRSSDTAGSPASAGPAPVLQKVAYYEDPGILMIVQSVQEDEDDFVAGTGTAAAVDEDGNQGCIALKPHEFVF